MEETSHKGTEHTKMDENGIGKIVVDEAIAIHRELGPGLFETVYEVILAHKLQGYGFINERRY